MNTLPKIAVGLPVFNKAEYLSESVESILSQSFGEFLLVIIDDCSSDGTEQIARRYAALDERITYERNSRRLGLVGSWRRAFERARELCPGLQYFAWASDHDLWHPRWLAAMLRELEERRDAVLAYPLNVRISERGELLKDPWIFDTAGLAEPLRRLRTAVRVMKAGDMVYGLFRAEALARAGIFQLVLAPDRLLLAELALYGEFRQVREVLWFRRFARLASVSRQRASFFPERIPLYAYLPLGLMHAALLTWHLAVRGRGRPDVGRLLGFGAAVAYAEASALRAVDHRWRRVKKQFRELLLKRAKILARSVLRHVPVKLNSTR
jgi:glycosyltransferase involved in cell wall biosynthesis